MALDPERTPHSSPTRLALVLGPAFALVLVSFALPEIPLDTPFADFWVRVSDTAYWSFMPVVCVVVVLLVVSRPGIDGRRRAVEAVVATVALLVVVAGNAQVNEHVIKPALAVPRPNIVTLAETGALGPQITEAADFYALGDKDARRQFLAPQLQQLDEPALSPLVEDHWAHETGFALPSGHSTAAMTFAALMAMLGFAWLTDWRARVTAVVVPVWAVLVAHSRVLLGVHTPTDVVVGSLVGIGLGTVAAIVVLRFVGLPTADRGADAP